MEKRKVILYISMSIDGFIASKDDDLSWLSVVKKDGEDYGYSDFCKQVDTYIVGRKTYEIVLKLTGGIFPQSEQFNCFVITRKERKNINGITFYNDNIETLINQLKNEEGKDIYCDGGAEIVKLLMNKNLIDEYIISVIPIVLGDGIPLFKGGIPEIKLLAKPSKHYKSGLVQLHYVKK